ncbi:MAG: divalent-cation tolerance protein CutA [Cyanobium sp.]
MAETPLEVVLTSEADPVRAEALARTLLERRLVACVSLQPCRSLYHWQGGIEDGSEVLMLLKTHPARLAELQEALGQLHSYDTPMWIHWGAASNGAYAQWLMAELTLG